MQDHAQAVDLGLNDKAGLLHPVIQFDDTLIPRPGVCGAEGICQGKDWGGVADLLEFLRYGRPGALGGQIGGDPVRMAGLDLAQFNHQFVKFKVADDGGIQHMIAIIMEVDLLLEFLVMLFHSRSVHGDSKWEYERKRVRLIIVWKGEEAEDIAPNPAVQYTGGMKITQTFQSPDRAAWREWLAEHGATETEVWLVYYKAGTGKPCISYTESLEEALCFGWVDSIIQKIDEEKYARKFNPRRIGSKWSELNKHLVVKLVKEGRMTEAGLSKVNFPLSEAPATRPRRPELPLPDWLKTGLMTSSKAWENF